MTENRNSDTAEIIRIHLDEPCGVKKAADDAKTADSAAVRNNNSCDAVEKIYAEENVNDMNTDVSTQEMRAKEQQTMCGEQGAFWEQEELLEELLAEIALDDAQVVVPLEAQEAWRNAIRAEAARSAEQNNPKIIRLNRWMRSVGSIAAALVVLLAGTWGIRLSEKETVLPTENALEYASYTADHPTDGAEEQYNGGMMFLGNGYVLSDGMGLHSDGKDDQSDVNATATQQTDAETAAPVVIRSAQRSIQSQEYDRDMQWLGDLVSEYGAYYEEKSETVSAEHQSRRVSTMVIRVPVERLDDFLTEMDQLGVTVMRSEKAEEITSRYMDTQSRLDALYQQRDTLAGMMAKAQSVQDVIAIDARQSEVLAEIERLEGDMLRWKNQQSYSTVQVTMTETFEQPLTSEASLGQRIKAGFDESVAWLKEFGQDALVLLVAFLPRAVIFIPAAVLLGVLIYAFIRKKKG